MKNKYLRIFFLLFFGLGLEYSNFLSNANANSKETNFQNEYNSSLQNKNIYFGKKNKSLINQSFYKNGYTFEESLRAKNQILNLFGISSKNKNSFFSFPEQRIESDSFIFWKTYKHFLLDQIPKNPKLTKDLDNGFNTSLRN